MSAARAGPIPGNSSSSAAVAVLMLRQLEGVVVTGNATPYILAHRTGNAARHIGVNGYTILGGYPVESRGTDTTDHREVLDRTEAA